MQSKYFDEDSNDKRFRRGVLLQDGTWESWYDEDEKDIETDLFKENL